MATCLEELPELARDGLGKEALCDVWGTAYIGEHHFHMAVEERHNEFAVHPAGGETVSDALASVSSLLIIPS